MWNIDTLINKINQLKVVTFNRINHLNFIEAEVKGNTAWTAYNNVADMTINRRKKNIQWLESVLLVREGKDWKIKLLHSTMVKPKLKNLSLNFFDKNYPTNKAMFSGKIKITAKTIKYETVAFFSIHAAYA